jgi:hypothetical protein
VGGGEGKLGRTHRKVDKVLEGSECLREMQRFGHIYQEEESITFQLFNLVCWVPSMAIFPLTCVFILVEAMNTITENLELQEQVFIAI